MCSDRSGARRPPRSGPRRKPSRAATGTRSPRRRGRGEGASGQTAGAQCAGRGPTERFVSAAERIGIFGGTFDPPHNGHLVAALAARHQLALDHVLMVVAGDPWQKRGTVMADAATRLALVECACEGIDGLVPSDVEVQRDGPTYT